MTKRKQRHQVIRGLIQDNVVKTQKDLAELLQGAGFDCTQATVSRDVLDMGLVKSADGRYVFQEELRLARLVSDLVEQVNFACNLVVVKTSPGAAQGVSAAFDGASLRGVLGTVAGDDTIMIACESEEAAASIARHVKGLM